MKKSKYVGKTFGRWTCTAIYLRKNYCHGTKHNAYRYQLMRITSDGLCEKVIFVSGTTMNRINKGLTHPELIALRMKEKGDKELLYRFIK